MKRAILVALGTGALVSSAAAIGIAMAEYEAPARLTRDGYESAIVAASGHREARLAACDAAKPAERDSCRAVADATTTVRLAQIEDSFHRTQASARASQRARIEGRYQLQRAQCQSLGGFKRDKCLVSAHAERGKALLEASAPYAPQYAAAN